jgi:hypothetical protein
VVVEDAQVPRVRRRVEQAPGSGECRLGGRPVAPVLGQDADDLEGSRLVERVAAVARERQPPLRVQHRPRLADLVGQDRGPEQRLGARGRRGVPAGRQHPLQPAQPLPLVPSDAPELSEGSGQTEQVVRPALADPGQPGQGRPQVRELGLQPG